MSKKFEEHKHNALEKEGNFWKLHLDSLRTHGGSCKARTCDTYFDDLLRKASQYDKTHSLCETQPYRNVNWHHGMWAPKRCWACTSLLGKSRNCTQAIADSEALADNPHLHHTRSTANTALASIGPLPRRRIAPSNLQHGRLRRRWRPLRLSRSVVDAAQCFSTYTAKILPNPQCLMDWLEILIVYSKLTNATLREFH